MHLCMMLKKAAAALPITAPASPRSCFLDSTQAPVCLQALTNFLIKMSVISTAQRSYERGVYIFSMNSESRCLNGVHNDGRPTSYVRIMLLAYCGAENAEIKLRRIFSSVVPWRKLCQARCQHLSNRLPGPPRHSRV